MKRQANKIFRKRNTKNTRGQAQGSTKVFRDEFSGQDSCDTAHHVMNLYWSSASPPNSAMQYKTLMSCLNSGPILAPYVNVGRVFYSFLPTHIACVDILNNKITFTKSKTALCPSVKMPKNSNKEVPETSGSRRD
jgi:hypothetical protein